MYGKEDEELRITFDFSIRSRRRELDLSAGDHGKLLLPDGSVVMEIKVRDTYPFWLVQALEEFEIYPASFSKYGKVFEEDILSGEIEKHHGSSVPRTALSRASGEYHPKKRRGFELPQNETRLRAGRIWKRRNPKYKKIP